MAEDVVVKNYYVILGVPADAAPRAIREAFRRAALRHHPDRGESADERAFRETVEAYEVLSDPSRRERYDRERHRSAPPGRPERPAPPRRRREAAERGPEPLTAEPGRVGGSADLVRPSVEDLLARFSHNFPGDRATKSEHAEPLSYELVLSPEEARRGVRFPLEIPVFGLCPACGGTGHDWAFTCGRCHGEGRLVEPATVTVGVPPGVRDGAVLESSLARFGVRNLWLRLHVRIAPH